MHETDVEEASQQTVKPAKKAAVTQKSQKSVIDGTPSSSSSNSSAPPMAGASFSIFDMAMESSVEPAPRLRGSAATAAKPPAAASAAVAASGSQKTASAAKAEPAASKKAASKAPAARPFGSPDIRLVAIDMDGALACCMHLRSSALRCTQAFKIGGVAQLYAIEAIMLRLLTQHTR